MNSFLLNRSQGSIRPSTFHTAQCARLVHGIEPALGIRFTSNPASSPSGNEAVDEADGLNEGHVSDDGIWAHEAGANVLAIDQYEKR